MRKRPRTKLFSNLVMAILSVATIAAFIAMLIVLFSCSPQGEKVSVDSARLTVIHTRTNAKGHALSLCVIPGEHRNNPRTLGLIGTFKNRYSPK